MILFFFSLVIWIYELYFFSLIIFFDFIFIMCLYPLIWLFYVLAVALIVSVFSHSLFFSHSEYRSSICSPSWNPGLQGNKDGGKTWSWTVCLMVFSALTVRASPGSAGCRPAAARWRRPGTPRARCFLSRCLHAGPGCSPASLQRAASKTNKHLGYKTVINGEKQVEVNLTKTEVIVMISFVLLVMNRFISLLNWCEIYIFPHRRSLQHSCKTAKVWRKR